MNNVKPGIEFGRQYPDQYYEIRFEDLVRRPAESLGGMLGWLGEEGDANEFSAIIKTARCASILRGSANGEGAFSPDDRKAFEELAGPILDHFSY